MVFKSIIHIKDLLIYSNQKNTAQYKFKYNFYSNFQFVQINYSRSYKNIESQSSFKN